MKLQAVTSSIESIVANDDFSIGTTGSYTWGSFEKVYDDWSLPYTVTQDQYGIDSNKVGYCCYLGWPTIKGADKNLANEIDEQGSNHAYEAWTNGLRLANRDGHRQRIECVNEAEFNNLAKSIAYALSGLNGKYNNCERQNLIWNSHIWAKSPYNADKVVEGATENASKIDTLGNVSLHFNDGNARTDKLVRAQQFATWAYQVLGDDNTLNLKLSPEKESEPESDSNKKLHVETDQATLSYWVGPYKLDLTRTAGGGVINDEKAAAGTSNQTLGDFVYKEIIMKNYGETSSNVFIKTRFKLIAEYTDGSIDEVEVKRNGDDTIAAQTDTSKRIVLTDSHGAALPYGVPTFGSEFYIRYYVSNPMKTLKYITPKIEASYLNNSMGAGGIKVHSTKVSYSIHYAICNYQDKSLRQYFTAQGYSGMDLGDFGDTSALREAYYYNTERNKTANIQDGITAVENIVKDSNAGPSNAKVTWYDDTLGGWSGEEDDYAAYWGYGTAGRCDGIIAFDTDYEKYVGGGISDPHRRFVFFTEFNSLDELYNCLTENYLLPIWVGIEGVTGVSQYVGKSWHKAESLFQSTYDDKEFRLDMFSHPELMVSKNCGCDKDSYCPGKDSYDCCGNNKCNSCDCNKDAEIGHHGHCGDDDNCKTPCDCGDDCDCGKAYISVPAKRCHCGCSCKYRYEAFEFKYNRTIYYRDVITPNVRHRVKEIGEKDEEVVKIPASDYIYETQQEALNAIKTRVDYEIWKVNDARKKEFDQWFTTNTYPAIYVPYGSEMQPYTKPFVEEYGQEQMQKVIYNLHTEGESTWKNSNYTLTKKEINEYLGGNVNENVRGIESRDGVQKDDIWQGAGIEVALVDLGPLGANPNPTAPKVVKVTLTDENGNYGFQRLNPLHTYKLQFRYDGLEFIDDLGNPTSMDSTTDISDTIRNRNTAAEIDQYTQNLSNDPRSVVQGRSKVNDNFDKIDASNVNYTGNFGKNKAYGWYTKLRGNNAKFIAYNNPELEPNGGLDNNVGAMRFVDAYYLFKKNAIDNAPKIKQGNIREMIDSYVDIESGRTITYDNIIKDNLPGILASKGVSTGINENNIEHGGMNEYDETKQVSNFIYDSLVVAETKIHFPDNAPVKFFLEDVGSGNTNDANNKTTNNTDRHNNYHHNVCDNPFPVNRGSGKRRVNSLYNNERTNNGSTINNRDQARNIDLRIKRREEANLLIAMDLAQVTLTVNGQKEIYKYGDLNLSEGNVAQLAKVSARTGQELQNYNKSYSRIITESMFLYKGSLVDEGNGDARDLSMYITYKIIIKNSGKVNLDVGYIVDHYDAYYLQWKSEDQAKIKTIVGSENCTAEVTPNDDGNHAGGSHPYNSDKKKLAAGKIDNMYNEVFIKVGKLAPEETKTMTITFEQQKDQKYKRLKINQDIETGALLIGDKNVVEIDGYTSTENDIFQKGLITRHSNIGNLCPVDFYDNGNKTGGLIDDKTNPVENRVEIDTAAGPNLVIYIPTDGYIPCISGYTYEDVRNKTVENAVIGNGKYDATNDKDYRKNDDNTDDKDKKIRGVTVQLVELVKEVDAYGLSSSDSANYIKEKIWGTTTFSLDSLGTDDRRGTDSVIYVPDITPQDKDVHRYSSGKDKAQIILNVKDGSANGGYLNVENKKDEAGKKYVELTQTDGMYKFVNVPPGVFVVRFIYGDTTQTMLVKNNGTDFGNEVNELLANKGPVPTTSEDSVINYEDSKHDQYMFLKGDSDGYISKEGLNEKSYNGNDYKSTIYQADLVQEGSYKGVNAYTDYEKQNFSNDNGYEMTQVTDGDILDKLYYYNITKADSHSNKTISDAKDIYSFRQNSDNYAKGYISTLSGNLKTDHDNAQKQALEDNRATGENPITLRNYRNEIMNSFEQIGTYTSRNVKPESVADNENYFDANRQVEMLKELMKYTRMVAQTGIINFEVEYTVNDWGSAHGSDKEYVAVDKLNNGTPESNNLPSNNFLQNERTKRYHIRDLNLGLVERPEAQIRLNKNAANVKIALSNGETLFDTNKSVNNMFYAKHKAHTYNFSKSFRLQSTKVSTNSLSTPELIQAYMDDELIENAILEVKYVYTIENVGEVDYLDKKFYYTGKEERPNDLKNISRTNIDEVLDYVPNKITFNAAASNELDELRVNTSSNKTKLNSGYEKSFWQVKSVIPSENNGIIDSKEYYKTYIYPFGVSTIDAQRDQTPINEAALSVDQLTGEYLYGLGGTATTGAVAGNLNADLVNREYFDRITSYANGSILTTDRLSTKKYNTNNYYSIQHNGGDAYTFGLIPKAKDTSKEEDYKVETPLLLSVTMSRDDDLVYPNLVEAVRISNSVGRRCKYSTVGNQPMANQNYASTQSSHEETDKKLDKYSVYSPVDVVTPIEIDADSSQSVRILPPTGFNKNNSNLYFALIGGMSIIIVSILVLKVSLEQKKRNKKANISRWK